MPRYPAPIDLEAERRARRPARLAARAERWLAEQRRGRLPAGSADPGRGIILPFPVRPGAREATR